MELLPTSSPESTGSFASPFPISNGKARADIVRLSVLSAITSTQQKLKLYNRVPDNGLCVFVGTVLNDEGKEKKISFALEPFKPINTLVLQHSPMATGQELMSQLSVHV